MAARVAAPTVIPPGAGGASVEVGAHETRRPHRSRAPREFGQRAGLDDRAVLEHHEPIGEQGGLERIVSHEEARDAECGQVSGQIVANPVPGLDVERGERLVEEEQVGLVYQRPRQGDTLRLPSGQIPGPGAAAVGHTGPVQPGEGPPASRCGRGAGGAEGKGHVLEGAEVGHQVEHLEDEADAPGSQPRALRSGEGVDVPAVQRHLAGGGPDHAADGEQQRALARAARSAHYRKLSGGDVDAHAIERAHLALGVLIDPADFVESDHRYPSGLKPDLRVP